MHDDIGGRQTPTSDSLPKETFHSYNVADFDLLISSTRL